MTGADAEAGGDRLASLLEGLACGRRASIAEALNLVDDRRPQRRELALELLDALAQRAGADHARRIGLTGAPGSGKSTLLNAILDELRGSGRSIGVIAVDPSSRRSGGALLGDRMRLGRGAREQGVFLRSMAARERLGGLADATHASVAILAAVFDLVFVETVGVGQSECDVASLADTLVFVAQPGAGDMLQFMKAGLLELPDLFVVNKADTGAAAENTRAELTAGLEIAGDEAVRRRAPVLLASARDGTGIREIVAAIDADFEAKRANGELQRLREQGRLAFVRESLMHRYGEYGLDRIGGLEGAAGRVAAAGDRSAFRLVLELGREIENAVRER